MCSGALQVLTPRPYFASQLGSKEVTLTYVSLTLAAHSTRIVLSST